MKIYYIINGRFPTEKANGYQISQMCQAFSECGSDVTILRPRLNLAPQHQSFRNNLKNFYNLRQEPRVENIWSYDFQFFFHRLGGFWDRFQFFTNLLHTASFVLGLAWYLRGRGQESTQSLVYLRDINILSWLHPLLGRHFQKNTVLELHYLPETDLKRKRYVRILNRAKAVICITNKMKEDLIALGYPADKLWVEHDGVDIETFQIQCNQKECRQELGYPPSDLIVGYVGNFHTNGQEKGVDDLIRASSKVLKTVPQAHFYFTGGPMDRVPRYQALIHGLHLPEEHFHFFDRRPVAQVPMLMKACDVLVIPLPWNPYFAYYMSPMKLFEYMASGQCIVATSVESLKEILVHDQNAILAQHSDVQDLATKLVEALQDPPRRARLASEAQKQVRFHSWRLRVQRVLEFIEKVV